MDKEGHLAHAIHTEADCPLLQETPERADQLADNLEEAAPLGGFYMKRHQGVALGKGAASEKVLQTYETVLPHHKITLETVDLTDFERFEDAESLDDPRIRADFFRMALPHFPEADLAPSEEEDGANLSLHQLPAYLREHAPGR